MDGSAPPDLERLSAPPETLPDDVWESIERAHHACNGVFDGDALAASLGALLSSVSLETLFAAAHIANTRDDRGAFAPMVSGLLTRILSGHLGDAFFADPAAVSPIFALGFRHQSAGIRAFTLDLMRGVLETESRAASGVACMAHGDAFAAFLGAVQAEHFSAEQRSGRCLIAFLRRAPAHAGEAFGALRDAYALAAGSDDSIVAVRVAELIAQCAGVSDECLQAADGSGALGLVLGLLRTDDVLVALNALTLLKHLCACPAGVRALFSRGVVDFLLSAAAGEGGEDGLSAVSCLDAMADVLLAVGELQARHGGGVLAGLDAATLSRFLGAALRVGASTGETGRLTCMWAICAYAKSSEEALARLAEDEDLLAAWLSLRGLTVDAKGAAVRSVASAVMSFRESEEGSAAPQLLQRLLERFAALNGRGSAAALCVAELRAPVKGLRCGVYALMAAMAAQRADAWGIRLLLSDGAVWALLRDRRSESDKACMECKFRVLEEMHANERRGHAMDAQRLQELQGELRMGPFVAPPAPAEMQTL